ncbi:hypothetical protein PCC79_13005 [Propioniciclava soli]|uniref:LppX_LprAFG lipoprotein n=1 Tax=Propioniciclava soli TaxID=2775081 RepID=A0ABZ3C596_9ACTN
MAGDQRPEDIQPDGPVDGTDPSTESIPGDFTDSGWADAAPTEALPVDEAYVADARDGQPDEVHPVAADPALTPAAATGGASAATAVAAPASGRGRRTAWIIGILVLLAALIAAGWWWWDSTQRAQREEAIRTTAQTYLDSLAAADAEGALATLAEQPANTTLLTDEVLQASVEASPLSAIAVGEVTSEGQNATADVTYRIGEEDVALTLPMTGDGARTWHLTDGLGELTLASTDHLTVNGAELTEATNPVFPGTYTAAATNQYLVLNGATSAFIPSPQADAATITPEFALSDPGRESILAAVRTRLDECVASTETLPGNCPFGLAADGAEVSNVRFQLNNDPWAEFAPALDMAAMTASGTVHLDITGFATVTAAGLTGDVDQNFAVDRAWSVNLTEDPLVVTWS